MKIIIGTPFISRPSGSIWTRLHYIIGFLKLGHDVYIVEEFNYDIQDIKKNYLKSKLEIFKRIVEKFGLKDKYSIIFNKNKETIGLGFESILGIVADSDLIINISGHIKNESLLEKAKNKAYIDDDPVYTQLWNHSYGKDLNFNEHDIFFSRGLNIGTPNCDIPDCSINWNKLICPVVTDLWDFNKEVHFPKYTTIASWKRYSNVRNGKKIYYSKVPEFEKFSELPSLCGHSFEVVLKHYNNDDIGQQILTKHGWNVLNAKEKISELDQYQKYIYQSYAEIGIAQHAYVHSNSGWFSDRSSHYLASGKPVLAQSTGLEQSIQCGYGFLTFKNMDEAVSGVEEINRNYNNHCKAARDFAFEYLDYRKILPKLLDVCNNN